ncbi:MAG: hypothetical protein IJ345_07910 [Clostridia bacterium]|nr:hypothetical protein [Clostridia bacterium]
MGRMLGAHDSSELDRPDLNKCPDCRCFFDGDNCPLCGKECPEEMRAGNRAKVKPQRRRSGDSGRVIFVSWYHSWWCIILALIFAPIIGIILLVTSPHKKSQKLAVVAIGVAWLLLSTFGFSLLSGIFDLFDKPVNTSLSREEYIAECDSVSVEDYYRHSERYEGDFLTASLIVKEKFTDWEQSKYNTYYLCSDTEGKYQILIRDCSQDEVSNYIAGDIIIIYGEGTDEKTVYDTEYAPISAPCINVAYIVIAD